MRRLLYFCFFLTLAIGARGEGQAFTFEEFRLAPLYVHLLASEHEPALRTTLTEADLERVLAKVNGVWAQAGLGFYIAGIEREAPAELSEAGESSGDASLKANRTLLDLIPAKGYRENQFNVYYLKAFSVNGIYFPRAIFVKDTAALRPVEGGIDEPLPRVTSHELGHALGLSHRQDTFNLMASGTTGTSLNEEEISRARARAEELGRFRPVADLPAMADALAATGHVQEARWMRMALAGLPVQAGQHATK